MFTLNIKPTTFSVKVSAAEFNQLLVDVSMQGYTVSSVQQNANGEIRANFKLTM